LTRDSLFFKAIDIFSSPPTVNDSNAFTPFGLSDNCSISFEGLQDIVKNYSAMLFKFTHISATYHRLNPIESLQYVKEIVKDIVKVTF